MCERKKLLWGKKLDDLELSRLIKQANLSRGGKPAKYPQLDKYGEIVKLIENDVQLPFILKWLSDEKGEKLVLNTLRKYVVFKIGRPAYETYLKRNGWMKTRRKPDGGITKKEEVVSEVQANSGTAAKQKQSTLAAPGENPLRALSGKPREGDYNPIPTAKFEVDNS
ncbi:MAG: hypothetical protein ACYCTH_04740 [Cellulomonas sp.]